MSTFLKVLLVVVVVGGITLAVRNHNKNNQAQTGNESAQNLSAGNSDADLDKDLASIDTSLTAVDKSSADVDAGLNDKPISQ